MGWLPDAGPQPPLCPYNPNPRSPPSTSQANGLSSRAPALPLQYWKLPRPDVLISVTGSAGSLQLTSQLQRVFDRGLVAAASVTKAWIFTGGTDSGVMKLVGEAMHKYGLDVPVVGVAPWGAILGRSTLDNCKGEMVPYSLTDVEEKKEVEPGAGAKLNPYHTHQILVDTSAHYTAKTPVFGQEQVRGGGWGGACLGRARGGEVCVGGGGAGTSLALTDAVCP